MPVSKITFSGTLGPAEGFWAVAQPEEKAKHKAKANTLERETGTRKSWDNMGKGSGEEEKYQRRAPGKSSGSGTFVALNLLSLSWH